jgi:uncharacterized protein with GYD domain
MEKPMAHYLLRWKFSAASSQNFVKTPQDRTEQARTLIEDFKGKMTSYFFSFGEYDGLAITEFPEQVNIAGCTFYAASTGAFERFEVVPLITAKEAEIAMQIAKESRTKYQAPHR